MTDEGKQQIVETRTGLQVPVSGRSAYIETIESDNAMEPTTLGGLYRLAEIFSSAKLCPKAFQGDPGSTMLVLMSAKQIGIPLVAALQNAYEIGGKVGWQSVVLEALVQRSKRCKQFHLKSVTDSEAVYVVQTDRMAAPVEVSYAYSEAQAAGLAGKDNWQKNRRDMLVARCRGRAARRYFAEECMGIYSVEELRDATDPTLVNEAARPIEVRTGADLLSHLAEEPQEEPKQTEWEPDEPFGVLEEEPVDVEVVEPEEPAEQAVPDRITQKEVEEIEEAATKMLGKRGLSMVDKWCYNEFQKDLTDLTRHQLEKLRDWMRKASQQLQASRSSKKG